MWSSRDSTTTPGCLHAREGEGNIRTPQRSKGRERVQGTGIGSGDIHRDRDATIVIRVEPTLPLNRLPEAVEVAAYYVVSEALTNVTKYARASVVHVEVEAGDRILRVAVRDDGLGGADPALGSGLLGLKDQVEAFGGKMTLQSPRGGGTSLHVELPLDDTSR